MAARGLEWLVVVHWANVYYLTGFTGSAGALLVGGEGATLVTDSRYREQAQEEAQGMRIRVSRQSALVATAGVLSQRVRRGAARVGFEAAHTTVADKEQLARGAGRGIRWVPVQGWMEGLRAVKDPGELATMRLAARLASEVFAEVLRLVKPGVREVDLAAEIDYRMRRGGASAPAFETIVAAGPRSAWPHARPTGRPLGRNELVVLDMGAILRHYSSDLTRTVYLGRAPSRIRRWYGAVREAQEAARQALKPGAAGHQVDAAARCVLRRHGLDRFFVHSTGHGLGIEVHEEPRLARGQRAVLEAGNVVTIEPGVYVEGVGGIRVEDDFVVQAQGAERLTSAPRELLEI
jgi:Xaa-Pro aminopeptidase